MIAFAVHRRGYDDRSDRYPRVVEAAKKIKGAFLIDGEAVVSGEDGIADFERLHSRKQNKSTTLWAFDLHALNGCANFRSASASRTQ